MELIRNAGPKGEGQRYAGALVLRELAEHAPAVLYDRRTAFFEDVWMVINDLTVRMCIKIYVFFVFSHCLLVYVQRISCHKVVCVCVCVYVC